MRATGRRAGARRTRSNVTLARVKHDRALAFILLAVTATTTRGALSQPRTSPLTPEKSELPASADGTASAADHDRLLGEIAALRARVAARGRPDTGEVGREALRAQITAAEDLVRDGKRDEGISRLVGLIESRAFESFLGSDEARAALYALGDAHADLGLFAPARAYLRRTILDRGAFDPGSSFGRRAARRLVDVALETRQFQRGVEDLAGAPVTDDLRIEAAFLAARAKETGGDVDGALATYMTVPQTSRFWSQATYLAGLLEVERGKRRDGERLFCKVADPRRQDRTTPVLADARFFAVRDLARLALGRVAHDEARFDDARYYYHLVPQDSDRLAEALYEAATSRYEKKDHEGARRLLDELAALKEHHRYEDEAMILGAYVDLARCRFPAADARLKAFGARSEPIREAARRLVESEQGVGLVRRAARAPGDPGALATPVAGVSPEATRSIAALVRADAAYAALVRRRAVLDQQTDGLRAALPEVRAAAEGPTAERLLAESAAGVRALEIAEATLARDALHRLDLRLSRLLSRARLGRIESVLGRKRALEVEIEAIANGFLPHDAVDSLDAARHLKDSEEYWPFEGDDWPDEYIGSEKPR